MSKENNPELLEQNVPPNLQAIHSALHTRKFPSSSSPFKETEENAK
jgi:hypothetical protein